MKEKIKKIFNKKNIPVLAITLTAILFYIILTNFKNVGNFVSKITGYFSPLVIGIVIAYLLNPVVKFFAEHCFGKIKWIKNKKKDKLANALAVSVTIILVVAVVVALVLIIVPEIFSSIEALINNIDN